MAPPRSRFCINQGIVDALQTELENSAAGEMLSVALRRAIKNVKKCRDIILTREDAQNIDGVGPYIANIIEIYLNENPPFPDGVPEHLLEAQRTAQPSTSSSRGRGRGRGRPRGRGRALGRGRGRGRGGGRVAIGGHEAENSPVHTEQINASDTVQHPTTSSTPTQKRGKPHEGTPRKRTKKYVPGVGTGAAALLIAMLTALKDERIRELRKDDLCERAQRYTEETVLQVGTSNPETWYDGWSSMNKQLIPNGLVLKHGRPLLFKLTDKGQHIAEFCLKQYEELQSGQQQKYDDEGIFGSSAMPPMQQSSGVMEDDQDEVCIVSVSPPGLSSSNPTNQAGAGAGLRQVEPQGYRRRNEVGLNHASEVVPVAHRRPEEQNGDFLLAQKLQDEFDRELGYSQTRQNFPSSTTPTNSRRSQVPSLSAGSVQPSDAKSTSEIDKQRGVRLAKKYAAGEEFGTVSNGSGKKSCSQNGVPGSQTDMPVESAPLTDNDNTHETVQSEICPSSTPSLNPSRHGNKRRRKPSDAQLQRICRVIEKLEREGESRQDLIMIVSEMFDQGKLPKTDDALDKSLRETFRAIQDAENEESGTPEPLNLVLTTLGPSEENRRDNVCSSSPEAIRNEMRDATGQNSTVERNPYQPGSNDAGGNDIIDLIGGVDETVNIETPQLNRISCADSDEENLRKTPEKVQERRSRDTHVDRKQNRSVAVEEGTEIVDLVDENEIPAFSGNCASLMRHHEPHDQSAVIVIDGNCPPKNNKKVYAVEISEARPGAGGYSTGSGSASGIKRALSTNDEPIYIGSDDDDENKSGMTIDRGSHGTCGEQPLTPVAGELGRQWGNKGCTNDLRKSESITPPRINNIQEHHSPEQDVICTSDDIQQTAASNQVIDLDSMPLERRQDPILTVRSDSNEMVRKEECEIILVIDSNERPKGSKSRTIASFAGLFNTEDIMFDVRVLGCGDALFLARFSDGSEYVLDYVVERKTIEDYASSMSDGRIPKQTYLLLNSNIANPLIVIEGNMKKNDKVYSQARMHSKLAELEVCADMYVKRTKDVHDTVHFYACIARRLQHKYRGLSKSEIVRGRQQFSEWSKQMDMMKRKTTLEELFMLQLISVKGLGIGKAQAVTNLGYRTLQSLYQAYEEKESMEEKEGLLNPRGSGIGPKLSRVVAHLFCSEDYNAENT